MPKLQIDGVDMCEVDANFANYMTKIVNCGKGKTASISLKYASPRGSTLSNGDNPTHLDLEVALNYNE